MCNILRVIAIVLLLFNGIGALVGGGMLMLSPDGTTIKMPLYYLQHSPFTDYFFPGLILFFANGLLSLVVAVCVLRNEPRYPLYIIGEGGVLTGWIAIQMMMLQMVYFLHYIMGGVGVSLMVSGILLHIMLRSKKNEFT